MYRLLLMAAVILVSLLSQPVRAGETCDGVDASDACPAPVKHIVEDHQPGWLLLLLEASGEEALRLTLGAWPTLSRPSLPFVSWLRFDDQGRTTRRRLCQP